MLQEKQQPEHQMPCLFFLMSHHFYTDMSIKHCSQQTSLRTDESQASCSVFQHWTTEVFKLIACPTARQTQPEVQADRLVRKRNNVLNDSDSTKRSEITDFFPFVCLWFIFVTCYSGSPAQRKTAPHARRCKKSTGAKLN